MTGDMSGHGGGPESDGYDVQATGERVEALLDRLAGDAETVEVAEGLVRELVGMYGAALQRVLDLAHDRAADPDELLEALSRDQLVAGLLALHDLHPVPPEERIEAALDGLRPTLAVEGGDLTLVGLDAGVARVRIQARVIPPMMRETVVSTVRAAAPELESVEVDSPPAEAFIPLESVRTREGRAGIGTGP